MVKKCSVLHEEVLDVFHDKFKIPTIENFHLYLLMLGFLVLCNVGRLEMIFPMIMYQKQYKVKEILCRKIQRGNWYINPKSTLGWK